MSLLIVTFCFAILSISEDMPKYRTRPKALIAPNDVKRVICLKINANLCMLYYCNETVCLKVANDCSVE